MLDGSALIFCPPRFRLSPGASEAKEARDCDLEPTKAEGVALACCRPLADGPGSREVRRATCCFASGLVGDFLVVLARVGDSVSEIGLTSL